MAQFEQAGAQIRNPSRGKPIHVARMETGLVTNRSPLHDPASWYLSKYGGYPDALIGGSNMEVSNQLTLIRRPGNSQFGTFTVPNPPNIFYDWRKLDTSINIVIDTPVAAYTVVSPFTTLTQIFTKAAGAGQGYYQGVGNTLYIGDGVEAKKFDGASVWNWGIVGPTTQPTVSAVQSGAGSAASYNNGGSTATEWSTMGLLFDSNGNVQQLVSVNAKGTNTTNFGTSGNGQPNFSSVRGVTTPDNTVTWTNRGQIVLWTATTVYNNFSVNGGPGSPPAVVYDPGSKSCFVNANPSGQQGTSGSVYPNFSAYATPGGNFTEGSVKWFYIGNGQPGATAGIPGPWKASTSYPLIGSVSNNDAISSICEPYDLVNGLLSNTSLFIQVATTGGTSGASGTNPTWSTSAGQLTKGDGDLIWLCLGNGTWAANHAYTPWTQNLVPFNVIKDTNGNFQVCTQSGSSDGAQPGTKYTGQAFTVVASGGGSILTITGSFSPIIPSGQGSLAGKLPVFLSGFTNSGNNGIWNVTSCNATTLVITNSGTGGVNETSPTTASITYNQWAINYGGSTNDGTTQWTCVGTTTSWAASTQWFLPPAGFTPPSTGAKYGGAAIVDSNTNLEFIINSGLGGTAAPTWATVGNYTADNPTTKALTQVIVNADGTGTSTYLSSVNVTALAGQQVFITGFAASSGANNGLVYVIDNPTSTSFRVFTTSQVNETHSGTANLGAIWYDLSAFNALSLAWTKSHTWAYSFKSLSATDPFTATTSPVGWTRTPLAGQGLTPPGITALTSGGLNKFPWSGIPYGSMSGQISTASPVASISVANTGAVVTVSGVGSTDPQVDTIVIWRDADGGGSSNMFELTEIPAPPPIGGQAQPWTFKDFLPDVAASQAGLQFPGLNPLIPAPINSSNNPPPAGFLPMAYHFGRIWGAVGNVVVISAGGETISGNGNESFNPVETFTFQSPVTKIVPTATGILVFLTSDVYGIEGGPVFASFFSTPLIPGVGLLNFGALDVHGGVIYMYSADNQFLTIDPSGGVNRMGGQIADQLALLNANKVFVTVHETGNDNAIFVSDGSTGWYRLNPSQFPNGTPVWSPFATIVGGAGAVQSLEITKGVHRLLIGGTGNAQPVLFRDLTSHQDNGTNYTCNFTMGSINLTNPGQIAGLDFVNLRAIKTGTTPAVGFLLNEISGSFTPFPRAQAYPWQIEGATLNSSSMYSNAYYFRDSAVPALAEHMQVQVSFPAENFANEVLSLTIFGVIEQSPEM